MKKTKKISYTPLSGASVIYDPDRHPHLVKFKGLGTAKLTVGERKNGKKITYCITALQIEKSGEVGTCSSVASPLNSELDSEVQRKDNKENANAKEMRQKFSGEPYTNTDTPYTGNGGRKGTTERGILDEYYTPDYVCEFMYDLAVKYGYKAGKVLEPSCATGNIIRPIYERNDYTHIDAFEINQTSRDICKKLFPNVTIYDNYFETAFLEPPRFSTKAKRPWLKNAPYDLAIGNPPYGKHVNRYSSYFSGKDKFVQIEMFFMYKCLDLLRSGGLLVFITSTNFMSTGNAYQGAKERIGEIADLVDAYRLPKVFERTDICTDIIVLRKK